MSCSMDSLARLWLYRNLYEWKKICFTVQAVSGSSRVCDSMLYCQQCLCKGDYT